MKTTVLLFIGCLVLFFSSCQTKEYTCQCQGGLSGQGATIKIEKSTKAKALRVCENKLMADGGAADGFHNCEIL